LFIDCANDNVLREKAKDKFEFKTLFIGAFCLVNSNLFRDRQLSKYFCNQRDLICIIQLHISSRLQLAASKMTI